MLILTRKPGESLYIGDNIKITIVEIKGNQIRVGIEAPKTLKIYREEIYRQILDENKRAAEAPLSTEGGLEGLTGIMRGKADETLTPSTQSSFSKLGKGGGSPRDEVLEQDKVDRDEAKESDE